MPPLRHAIPALADVIGEAGKIAPPPHSPSAEAEKSRPQPRASGPVPMWLVAQTATTRAEIQDRPPGEKDPARHAFLARSQEEA